MQIFVCQTLKPQDKPWSASSFARLGHGGGQNRRKIAGSARLHDRNRFLIFVHQGVSRRSESEQQPFRGVRSPPLSATARKMKIDNSSIVFVMLIIMAMAGIIFMVPV